MTERDRAQAYKELIDACTKAGNHHINSLIKMIETANKSLRTYMIAYSFSKANGIDTILKRREKQ